VNANVNLKVNTTGKRSEDKRSSANRACDRTSVQVYSKTWAL